MATKDMQQLSAKERNLFKLILSILESSGLLELFLKVLKEAISKKKKIEI